MHTTSEAGRRTGSVAVIALLIAAIAMLVAGPTPGTAPWSDRAEQAVEPGSERPTRALEALRAVSFSGLHHVAHVAHVERIASGFRAPATLASVAALVMAALAGSSAAATAAIRGRARWWGGRCRRCAPPDVTTV